MSEPGTDGVTSISTPSAGALLRAARQAQGLHIAALAASIKVSQRKLELLEADRLSELPDATFARALAQTICRSLKIDPAPVLAALPQATGYRLDAVDGGINAPFRDRPGRHEPDRRSAFVSPAVWVTALIAAAALLVLLMPAEWATSIQGTISGSPPAAPVAAAPAATVAEAPPVAVVPIEAAVAPTEAASAALVETAASAVVVELAASAAGGLPLPVAAAVPAGVGPLQLKASADTWVEVVDGQSTVLVSRLLARGETLVLDGASPFRLKIGNAAGTEVAFRGQAVNLASATRDNVARLELK
ncbi:MAG: helix-turn-helix domain-containing protein [Burkholderiaceae bacterium]|nr:helix-turn-helix domain-containing protein [Burkholderiaceae bacterium]